MVTASMVEVRYPEVWLFLLKTMEKRKLKSERDFEFFKGSTLTIMFLKPWKRCF